MLTLNKFLSENHFAHGAARGFVKHEAFATMYLRISTRRLEGELYRVLDVARIAAKRPGSGAFTRLDKRLTKRQINVYVESVLEPRFASWLLRHDYVKNPTHEDDYYKLNQRR